MSLVNHTYQKLSTRFYKKSQADKIPKPQLIQFNHELADFLNLDLKNTPEQELARLFSGQTQLKNSKPIAIVYAGHQFGHFVPQLGDGRALLLGDTLAKDKKTYDLQLKGSGPTPFSRGGDGKSPVGPVIREYILSEFMYKMDVPTTRALAAVETGETITRQRTHPGAIFTRVAESHIRIGTFEYFAYQGDKESLEKLLNYSIERHYPHLVSTKSPANDFLNAVTIKTAQLIAKWMSIGFIHGVMNTDNTSIGGFTIDFGPCAFMDDFRFDKVFSSIDRHGRYAFHNQPSVAVWNLERLKDSLSVLADEDLNSITETFTSEFNKSWIQLMGNKLGIQEPSNEDSDIIDMFLLYLQKEKLDFTHSFRNLSELLKDDSSKVFPKTDEFETFYLAWKRRLSDQNTHISKSMALMDSKNPIYIARNHIVEKCINQAENKDYTFFNELNEVLKDPFTKREGFEAFASPPQKNEVIEHTFCGT